MDKLCDLVNKAARTYYSKSYYKIRQYVFAEFEDIEQTIWVGLLSRKNIVSILNDIEGNEGLIVTVAQRAIIDYVRTIIGRDRKDKDGNYITNKKSTWFAEINHMTFENEDGEEYSIQVSDEGEGQKLMFEETVKKEIDDFLKSKLSRREKMIYDYVKSGKITMKEAGKYFSITESRISQIKKKIDGDIIKHYERFG